MKKPEDFQEKPEHISEQIPEEKPPQKPEESSKKEQETEIKQVGVFITVPFILAVSPIVGWLLGGWLDKKLDTAPYLMYVGVLAGFVAGFRELYRLIKRFGNGK